MTSALSSKTDVDARRRTHPSGETIRRESASVVDDEVGRAEVRTFIVCRADEHRVHEEGVIRQRADDADLHAILRIPSGETIDAIEPLARVEVIDSALAVDFENVLVARDVHGPPPKCRVPTPDFLTIRLSFGERPVFAPE